MPLTHQSPGSPFLANFGIADNSGVEQHNRHPLAVKRDAAQDPRRGIHQSGVSARRLGACAAQTLFAKPGLVANLDVVSVRVADICREVVGTPFGPKAWFLL